jgi:hypothetical protein
VKVEKIMAPDEETYDEHKKWKETMSFRRVFLILRMLSRTPRVKRIVQHSWVKKRFATYCRNKTCNARRLEYHA